MDWRRDDTGYAAAALVAVGFAVYLVAANFGLVPPVLGALGGATPAQAAIAIAPDVFGEGGGSGGTDLPTIPAAPKPRVTPRPAVAIPTPVPDTAHPVLAFSTPDGTALSVAEPATVEGKAADLHSGVDEVLVTFSSGGNDYVVPAEVTCDDAARRTCTWVAKVPAVVADYSVSARATDRAGNVGDAAPIGLTVVNTGGVVEQIGETVQRVPSVLTSTIDTLLTLLTGP